MGRDAHADQGRPRILRQPALTVAPGTAETASAHIRTVAERLKLGNRQIREAHRRLEALCAKLAEGDGEEPPGQAPEQPLCRRDYHALRTLSGVARDQAQRQTVPSTRELQWVASEGLFRTIRDPGERSHFQ